MSVEADRCSCVKVQPNVGSRFWVQNTTQISSDLFSTNSVVADKVGHFQTEIDVLILQLLHISLIRWLIFLGWYSTQHKPLKHHKKFSIMWLLFDKSLQLWSGCIAGF